MMIYENLAFTAGKLNEHFRDSLKINEEKVALSAIMNQDGTVAISGENKIVITLLNIHQKENKDNELYILFSAYFSDYAEALRFIDFIQVFFNENPVIKKPDTVNNTGGNALRFEIINLDFATTSATWQSIGAKQMPFLIYKMSDIQ